jgi:hypothetical protein
VFEGLDLGSVTPILLLGNGSCSDQRRATHAFTDSRDV